MKKVFLLPLLLCLFLVTACKDDDKPAPQGPAASALIQGTWITLEMKYELFNAAGTKLSEKKEVQYDRFTFEDGKVTALDASENPTATTYSISGESSSSPTLLMTIGSLPASFAITAINSTSMTLQATSSGDTQKLKTELSDKEARLAKTRLIIQLNKLQ